VDYEKFKPALQGLYKVLKIAGKFALVAVVLDFGELELPEGEGAVEYLGTVEQGAEGELSLVATKDRQVEQGTYAGQVARKLNQSVDMVSRLDGIDSFVGAGSAAALRAKVLGNDTFSNTHEASLARAVLGESGGTHYSGQIFPANRDLVLTFQTLRDGVLNHSMVADPGVFNAKIDKGELATDEGARGRFNRRLDAELDSYVLGAYVMLKNAGELLGLQGAARAEWEATVNTPWVDLNVEQQRKWQAWMSRLRQKFIDAHKDLRFKEIQFVSDEFSEIGNTYLGKKWKYLDFLELLFDGVRASIGEGVSLPGEGQSFFNFIVGTHFEEASGVKGGIDDALVSIGRAALYS